jgi:putative transcriptional regulator
MNSWLCCLGSGIRGVGEGDENVWPREPADISGSNGGVSRQTVNAIETGRYDPSLPLAFDIARTFECRIEDIFQPNGDAGPRQP